jgi:hypothetical protein
MSVTLSTSVVIVSDSTGSRPIVSNSLMPGTFLSRSTPANNGGQATPGVSGAGDGWQTTPGNRPPIPPRLTRSVGSRPAGPGGNVVDRLLVSVFF